MYKLYERVTRNIQNRHKRIHHMNSFINAKRQRKLRKFLENPLSGSRVSGLGYHLSFGCRFSGLGFHLWDGSLVSILGSHQKSRVSGPTFWICCLYECIRFIRDSSFTRYFKIISMRSFVHFMLSELLLSGVGTLNKLIPLSFLEVGKTQFSPGIIILFSEIIKLQAKLH